MSVVVTSAAEMPTAIEKIVRLGYIHQGEGGIPGRHAFQHPQGMRDHHLFACLPDSIGLLNPLAFRDFLRAHPDIARQYGLLKMDLARRFPLDRTAYTNGKSEFILGVLDKAGFDSEALDEVRDANSKNRGAV